MANCDYQKLIHYPKHTLQFSYKHRLPASIAVWLFIITASNITWIVRKRFGHDTSVTFAIALNSIKACVRNIRFDENCKKQLGDKSRKALNIRPQPTLLTFRFPPLHLLEILSTRWKVSRLQTSVCIEQNGLVLSKWLNSSPVFSRKIFVQNGVQAGVEIRWMLLALSVMR